MKPNGELFTDLQGSLTEIFLIELFGKDDELVKDHRSRLNGNYLIRDAIKSIMKERFSRDDVEKFLADGYPRSVDLTKVLPH